MFSHLPLPKAIAIALEALPIKTFGDYGLPDQAYAGLVLEQSGQHVLILGDRSHNFWSITPEQQAYELTHEYTHLAFGHLLKCAQAKLHPKLHNIATDAWINEVHPHHNMDRWRAIYYTQLRQEVPQLPPWLLDPMAIYRILEQHPPPSNDGGDTWIVQPLGDAQAVGRASIEVLKARAALMEAAQEDPSLQAIVDDLLYSSSTARTHYTSVTVAHWLEAIYQQVNQLASQKQGELQRERGWRRPGRVPGVAGSTRRPSLHVMLALDVSGSTTAWWPAIIAATRGLSQLHDIEIVCHAEEIVFQGSTIPVDAPVGGGTDFTPVVKAASACKPDCLIWVTDGHAAKVTLPHCPIYWVWLPQSSKWPLRTGDFQTEYV